MTFSDLYPDFKVMIIQRQIIRKYCNIELYLQWPTNRKSYMIYRTAPFSMTLNQVKNMKTQPGGFFWVFRGF